MGFWFSGWKKNTDIHTPVYEHMCVLRMTLLPHEPLEPEVPEGNSWQNVQRPSCQGLTQCDQYPSGREEIMIQRKLSFRGKRLKQLKELLWPPRHRGTAQRSLRKEGVSKRSTQGRREARPWPTSPGTTLKHLDFSHQTENRMFKWQSPAILAWKSIVILKSKFLCQMTNANIFNP